MRRIVLATFHLKKDLNRLYTVIFRGKSATNYHANVEDVIVQGLGNQERRNILKVIKLAKDGAIYSEILGELELNSGLLNYHMKQLEGLITKNTKGQYILTLLVKKL
jgi:DNA primase catalytic subunit